MKSILHTSVLILLLAISLQTPAFAQQNQPGRITIKGSAGIDVNPDKVVISFGIETDDMDIEKAKQKNNEIHAKAMSVFKELGIESKHIQTDRLSIEPRWDSYQNHKKFEGYFVTNNVAVTLTDVAKLEELITLTLKTGVNHIHGVDFQVNDYKKYREEARVMALKAAREKAIKMAEVLGEKIGRPQSISEGWAGIHYGGFSGRSGSHMMIQNVVSTRPTPVRSMVVLHWARYVSVRM